MQEDHCLNNLFYYFLIKDTDETTKKNVYESQYIVALCNYLIVRGYKAEEITILTTYNGQIFQFAQVRKETEKE